MKKGKDPNKKPPTKRQKMDFIHRNLCFDDSGNDMRGFRA